MNERHYERHPYATVSSVASSPQKATTIGNIPNEILEKIFKFAAESPVPLDERYPHRPLFSKLESSPTIALWMSQVCSRWRQITLRMPTVWTHLHLSRSREASRRLKHAVGRSLDWLAIYLARSGKLPLHITIDSSRIPIDSSLKPLHQYSSRWQTLIVLVSHVGNVPPILPLFGAMHTPNLQALTIASDLYREGIVSYEPMLPFLTDPATRLSSVHLYGVYLSWNSPPMTHISTLDLRYTTRWPAYPNLKTFFAASPALTTLVVHDDINAVLRHVAQPSPQSVIKIPSLRSLQIKTLRIRDTESKVAAFMSIFALPALEHLEMKDLEPKEWLVVAKTFGLPNNPRDFDLWTTYARSTSRFPSLVSLDIAML